MKAPNGEPTKLTEEQWLLVRTPNFKGWFGDWEYNLNEKISPIDLTGVVLKDESGKAVNVKNIKSMYKLLIKMFPTGSSVEVDSCI